MVKSRDSFCPGRVKGVGPGVWGILVLRARRFLVTWSLHGVNVWDGKLFLCLITIYCNLTLFSLLLCSNSYSATGGLARHQNGQVCLNIYFLFYSFVYFFIALP